MISFVKWKTEIPRNFPWKEEAGYANRFHPWSDLLWGEGIETKNADMVVS